MYLHMYTRYGYANTGADQARHIIQMHELETWNCERKLLYAKQFGEQSIMLHLETYTHAQEGYTLISRALTTAGSEHVTVTRSVHAVQGLAESAVDVEVDHAVAGSLAELPGEVAESVVEHARVLHIA